MRPTFALLLALALPLSGCLTVHEQRPAPAAVPAPAAAAVRAPARPADVATPEAIVAALYATISGAAGQPRDWERMHSLFAPEGRMAAIGPRPGGMFGARTDFECAVVRRRRGAGAARALPGRALTKQATLAAVQL
jgi:hypothetical protein